MRMGHESIRKMTPVDIPYVMQIDENSFTSPWSRDIYIQELEKNDFAHYFVLIKNHKIVGYIGMWLVIDDAQITNIAVEPNYRGHGLGEKLFAFALAFAFKNGAKQLSLEVRVTNNIAQNMYRKFGLKYGGIRKNYYPDNGEDAYVMWTKLTDVNFAAFYNDDV